MKILLNGRDGKRLVYKTYLQKRDLLYLEETGRCFFPLSLARCIDEKDPMSKREQDFVYFEGEDAYRYFEAQKEILNYDDYLEMSSVSLKRKVDKELDRRKPNLYICNSCMELLMEKSRYTLLPYPIQKEESFTIQKYHTEEEQYHFYKSYIPKLYYFEKEDETLFYSPEEIPFAIKQKAAIQASLYTFEDEDTFCTLLTEDRKRIVMLPTEEEEILTSPERKESSFSYWKRFISRNKNHGGKR